MAALRRPPRLGRPPEERLIDVHRDGHPVATLNESESLDGLDVLPGFSCAVREVFGA